MESKGFGEEKVGVEEGGGGFGWTARDVEEEGTGFEVNINKIFNFFILSILILSERVEGLIESNRMEFRLPDDSSFNSLLSLGSIIRFSD